jgi:acyl-CoA thioesterase
MADDNSSLAAEAQRLAEACGAAMYDRDYAAQALGIHLAEIRPGYACMKMRVRKDMVNGHDICHGGMTFALADTAFAYACNSRNQVTVASGCTIDYVTPSHLHDELTAVGIERSLSGRVGIYDVTVSNQKGEVIAHFRGRSYRITGEVIQSLEIEL